MTQPKITIGVPVYNAQPYLKKCIESIIQQTYSNLEIILYNDGSIDESLLICEEYKNLDNRIVVISNKNNGLCYARNYILNVMSSQYIMFVDCDDWVESDIVTFLYNKLIEFDLDFSSCTGIDHIDNSSELTRIIRKGDKIFSSIEGIKDFYGNQDFTFDAIQCKLYRKSCFNNICFTNGRTTDDTLTTPQIIANCTKIGYFDIPKYNYLVRSGSMCRTPYNSKAKDRVLAYIDNYAMISETFPFAIENLKNKIFSSSFANLLKILLLDVECEYASDKLFYLTAIKKYQPKLSIKNIKLYVLFCFYSSSFRQIFKFPPVKTYLSKILNI